MDTPSTQSERLLLIDTCGETAGVALSRGNELLIAEDLARGSASAEILQAIRRLLTQMAWELPNVDAIGVVRGPGSFTGTRSGLATAKGLCEATGLRLAAVSRLEVLANAAGLAQGYAALDAGRSEVYLRDIGTQREWLSPTSELRVRCQGQRIAVAEKRLLESLQDCDAILHPLHVADSLATVLRRLREGGSDVALSDANYVRDEADIYRKPSGASA